MNSSVSDDDLDSVSEANEIAPLAPFMEPTGPLVRNDEAASQERLAVLNYPILEEIAD